MANNKNIAKNNKSTVNNNKDITTSESTDITSERVDDTATVSDSANIKESKNVFIKENKDVKEIDKKKLAEKISKIVILKADLKQVKDIILEYNPDAPHMKNSNGIFFPFNDLEPITYTKLNEFVKKIELKELRKTESELCGNNSSDDELAVTYNMTKIYNGTKVSKKLRLTNTENHLINRAKYEQQLKENNVKQEEEAVLYDVDNVKTKDINKETTKDAEIFAKNFSNDSKKKKSTKK